MRLQLSEENPHKFEVPSGISHAKVCITSQSLPCSRCPKIREDVFAVGTEPKHSCNNYSFRTKNQNSNGQDTNRDKILDGISF